MHVPEKLTNLWNLWSSWQIPATLLGSFIVQAVLVFCGSRRKYSTSKWISRFVLYAYLFADWVATVSLSHLSDNSKGIANTPTDPNQSITAFWAPFLLLHLGGPDTITAYSLEDNELWWRFLLVLFVQVGLAGYVLFIAWAGHALDFLAIPIYVCGILKFVERTFVLRYASSKHFRESMFPDREPDPGPDYAAFVDYFNSKKDEGFFIEPEGEAQVPTGVTYSLAFTKLSKDDVAVANLKRADVFFQIFSQLFADLIISIHDILNSQFIFRELSCKEAFEVIEIELGFIYDLFYTKAALYSIKGMILRVWSSVSITTVFVIFLNMEKNDYKRLNVIITYVLLGGAIFFEVYAAVSLVCSNWSILWLSKHRKLKKAFHWLYPIISFPPNKQWSNVIKGYSLVDACLGHRRWMLDSIFSHDPWNSDEFMSSKQVPAGLKEKIFDQLMPISRRVTTLENCKEECAHRGDYVLKNVKVRPSSIVLQSIEEEFDRSILLWHIATDLCSYSDRNLHSGSSDNPDPVSDDLEGNSNSCCFQKCDFTFGKGTKISDSSSHCEARKVLYESEALSDCEASTVLSEYMLYLLVMRPFMLPNGIGTIRFQDTCAEATKFFKQRNCKAGDVKARQKLLDVSIDIPPASIKGDRSKSLLFDACKLAKELQSMQKEGLWTNDEKWNVIRSVWVEMLCYAANQCPWNPHAKQLAAGGELLTHVWFLMAHLGITEQRQKGYARSMFKIR